MQSRQDQGFRQRIENYQASKTVLFWSCVGSAVAAMVIGFSWGGWVTGGSARNMVEASGAKARQELAATVCVQRFSAAPDVDVRLAALREISSSYAQAKFVEEGGWAVIVPASDPVDRKVGADDRKAAALCAENLLLQPIPAAASAAQIEETTVVQ